MASQAGVIAEYCGVGQRWCAGPISAGLKQSARMRLASGRQLTGVSGQSSWHDHPILWSGQAPVCRTHLLRIPLGRHRPITCNTPHLASGQHDLGSGMPPRGRWACSRALAQILQVDSDAAGPDPCCASHGRGHDHHGRVTESRTSQRPVTLQVVLLRLLLVFCRATRARPD